MGLVSSWKLTLVLLAALPLAALALWAVSRNLSPAIEAQKRHLTLASKHSNTAITSINTVKAFNGQDEEVWWYYVTIREAAKSYLIQARANSSQSGVLKVFMAGIFVQGFWYGIFLVNRGISPGNVVTAFYSCLTAIQALEVMLPQVLVLTRGMSAGATLRNIMDQIQSGGTAMGMGGTLQPDSCSGDVEMNDVCIFPAMS